MPELTEIAAFLDGLLHADWFGEDPIGIVRDARRPVETIGLILDPFPGLGEWIASERIDALCVHRPWGLSEGDLGGAGVLAYHLPFDEGMTVGYNPRLAAALGMTELKKWGGKDFRPIGMTGGIEEQPFDEFVSTLWELFGGLDLVERGDRAVLSRVAVVGAMSRLLVHSVRSKGAQLYVTGEYREIARPMVVTTGLGVVAVGHRRSEVWGLRELGAVLNEEWPGLRLVVRV